MHSNPIEILLVEDNVDDAELTIRALKKNKIVNELTHVNDGAEALEFIFASGKYAHRNIEELPKVILLDLKMPKVNGLDLLRKLKSEEVTKGIPIVVLTSSKEDPDVKECYRLGANSYIVKPVEFESFIKAVSELGFYWLILNQTTRS